MMSGVHNIIGMDSKSRTCLSTASHHIVFLALNCAFHNGLLEKVESKTSKTVLLHI